jgi:transcriptional regulator GlxA family with amidase domain
MGPALEAIMANYAEPPSVAELAVKVSLSVSQFERQFKKKFQTTPLKYIARIRIEAACRLLVSTDQSLSAIALQTGFYDQSHFTNQFVRLKGMTPSLYRKEYGPGTAGDDTGILDSKGR